jgi:hypothetical protein
MKKLFNFCLIGLSVALISWGFKGHRADRDHRAKTPDQQYRLCRFRLLERRRHGRCSATWADENKNKSTAPWHFLNLPLGLNHEQFVQAVQQSDNNTYTAILKTEATLKDKTLSVEQKNEALKYLIHLVGDAHQPMHISRKEDKGGNTIQVRFDNKGTNLHSLWDSKLIDHEGLSEPISPKLMMWLHLRRSNNGRPTARWNGSGKATRSAVNSTRKPNPVSRSTRLITRNIS